MRYIRGIRTIIGLLGILSTVWLPAQAQNLVQNPGFETVGPNGSSTVSTQSGSSFVGISAASNWAVWNFGSSSGVNTVTTTRITPSTLPGGQTAMLRVSNTTGVGAVYQGVSSLSGPATATLSLLVTSGQVLVDLSLGGGPPDGFILTGATADWTTFVFTSSGPADQIRIFANAPNTTFFVDNVSVTAAAPEPSALALLLPALFSGLAAIKQRRKRKIGKHFCSLIAVAGCTLATCHPVSAQIFVADFGNNRIDRYSGESSAFPGTFSGTFVTAGSGGLQNPFGLVFAPNGDLLVGSFNSRSIKRYSGVNGAYLGDLVSAGSGGLGNPFGPYGMILDSSGNLLVSNLDGTVKRYNSLTGTFLGDFVTTGSLSAPHGLAYGNDGNLYVSDFGDNTVKRYNGITGAFLGTFVSSGSGGLITPTGLTFGPNGNLFVTSTDTNQILQYDGATGAFVNTFISNATLVTNGRPWGLQFSSTGELFVGSGNSPALIRYNGTTGALIGAGGFSQTGTYLVIRATAKRRRKSNR
jgi:hypothetical protein